MKCSHCSHVDTKVLESRETREGSIVRRRRECTSCGYRFTTFEKPEEQPLYIIKKNGTRELFDKQKLLRSMFVACQKRSVSHKDLESLADWVEKQVALSEDKETTSAHVGELVLEVLRYLDSVAYVRFASVYRAFSSPEDFVRELQTIEQNAQFKKLPDDLDDNPTDLNESAAASSFNIKKS